MYGLYRDWLYRTEICGFLDLSKLERCVGCIEGLDERDGEMVVWFQ